MKNRLNKNKSITRVERHLVAEKRWDYGAWSKCSPKTLIKRKTKGELLKTDLMRTTERRTLSPPPETII